MSHQSTLNISLFGKKLTREELKFITGGSTQTTCKPIGSPCMYDYECCVNACVLLAGMSYRVCYPVN